MNARDYRRTEKGLARPWAEMQPAVVVAQFAQIREGIFGGHSRDAPFDAR
jgi:hypothetical protein